MMESESQPDRRMIYLCHCQYEFFDNMGLLNHAFQQHSQFVKSFQLTLTSTQRIYTILDYVTLPIAKQQPQLKLSQLAQSSTPAEKENISKNDDQEIQIIGKPVKVVKKRGRKPKVKTRDNHYSPQEMQITTVATKVLRENRWIDWFNSSFATLYNHPQIDFTDLTNNIQCTRLAKAISKYMATWGIKQKEELDQQTFRCIRDRLIIFNTMLLSEEIYLKRKRMDYLSYYSYSVFFNYFISNFLPNIILERIFLKWMKKYSAFILLRRHLVLKEMNIFVLWCKRNGHLNQSVHRNPSPALEQLLIAESSIPNINIQIH